MRRFLLLAGLAFTGCPAQPPSTGQTCDYECRGDADCIGFRCVNRCELEGDCPVGFRCVDGSCLGECTTQEDCAGFGVCESLGEEFRGSACALRDLPQCAEDWHCNWPRVCDGRDCVPYCDEWTPCPPGQTCRVRDDYVGMCEIVSE